MEGAKLVETTVAVDHDIAWMLKVSSIDLDVASNDEASAA
jgi:hypothetical protein